MKPYQVIIVGAGLSGLSTAMGLCEQGIKDILIIHEGMGGTPYIAAINFLVEKDSRDDSAEAYFQDMMNAGYEINDQALVRGMVEKSNQGYAFLLRQGVTFAKEADGREKLRHLSGHSKPRSLCMTTGLIGQQMQIKLIEKLKGEGVTFMHARCVRLLSDKKRVYGVTVLDRKRFNKLDNIYAPNVVAAWGGVGHLAGPSTYPNDIGGDTLALAHRAGANLVDLEFIEYEPMVVLWPEGAAGEPCPTAMLGEGAYLKNNEGERFLLEKRPEGEAGAPKSLINHMIFEQADKGKTGVHGGVFADLRHIDKGVLEGYPWFYQRMLLNGVDPSQELIEVAPMAHSFSGGIEVNTEYQASLKGFYAVGEAAGGVHGACRCAGNAASQAVISGMICAQGIARSGPLKDIPEKRFECERRMEYSVFLKYGRRVREIAAKALGGRREESVLMDALDQLDKMNRERPVRLDEDIQDMILSLGLILESALFRRESRGTHVRRDYPIKDERFQKQMVVPGQKE